MGGNLAKLMNVEETVAAMSPGGSGWDSIPAMTAAAADRFGDRLAVIDGDERLTYAELLHEARTFGAGLVAAGVEPGDRVAIWAPNSARWIVAVLGLFQAGAVLVPVNTRFKGAEAVEILRRSDARALVTVTDFLGTDYVAMLRATGVELPSLATVIVAAGPTPDGTEDWARFLARATDEGRAEVARRAAAVGADDPSDILFTSGTTGVPKGVVQTHGRTLLVATDWVAMTGLTAGDRYLMVNPYFHMFGLKAGILACVAAGATMLPEPVFDPDRALARVEAEGVTVLPGAPTLYQSILDHPDRDRYDLTSLRIAVTGAADIPVELIRRIVDELPFPTIITGYGLTEGGTAAATSPDDDVETIATTVGRPRPGFELRLVDGDGHDVEPGEAGRDPAAGRQHHVALPRRPRGHRRGPLGRRLAAHRRPRRSSTTPAACASWGGRRTCSSSAGSTPIPPRSRTPSCATTTSSRPPSSASPTNGSGRSAWRSWCCVRGPR